MKTLRWVVIGLITLGALLTVVLLSNTKSETEFDRYNKNAQQINVVDWTISEDTAKAFADANCNKLANGHMPAIKFQNENHVKSSAAVIAAYCPDSEDNFLAGLVIDYPQYTELAKYINDRIKY